MRGLWVAMVAVGLVACGDPETTDTRGYTKAPLEEPGLLIAGEPATVMDELGVPDRPRPRLLDVEPEPEPAEQPAQQPAQPAQQPAAGNGEQPAGGGAASGVTLAAGVTQAQFDQGQQLFSGAGACGACHGPDAGGSQLGPNLRDDEWLHLQDATVDAIAGIIRSGVSNPIEYPAPMPAMGGANLTPEQVQALAGYLASL